MTTKPNATKRSAAKPSPTKQGQSSKTYVGTVSGKRQITIPAELFRALRLQAGAKVSMKVEEGKLQVEAEPLDFDALLKKHQLPPNASRDSVKEVREMRGWTEWEE